MAFEIDEYIKHFSKYPRPALQKKWGEVYDAMAVHSREKTPTKLINIRRPYEDDAIKDYRLKNYEAITKSSVTRGIDSLQRIMGSAAVHYNMPDDLSSYLAEPRFMGVDFNTFFNKHVLRRMIEDPNGLLVWWPTGEGVEQGNRQVEPVPVLVLSKLIYHYTEEVLTFIAPKKSVVKVLQNEKYTEVLEGLVYYIITKDKYYEFAQTGKKADNEFELIPVYPVSENKTLDMARLPVSQLGGHESGEIDETTGDEYIYQTSYFDSFIAFANEAIRQFSDHQAIMVTSGHPIREMDQITCTDCNGKGLRILDDDDPEKARSESCGTCNGQGSVAPTSPFGVIFRKAPNPIADDGVGRDVPALRYITPDVEIVKYSGEHWRTLLDEADQALNLQFVDEAQSGVAKDIDREEQASTLNKIGSNIYGNLVLNSLKAIQELRKPGNKDAIAVHEPNSYRPKTEAELIDELDKLRKADAPIMMITLMVKELLNKRYHGNKPLQKAVEFLSIYDPLFAYTEDQKTTMLAAATISDEDYTRSMRAFPELQTIIFDKGTEFVDMDYQAIQKALDAAIQPHIPSRPGPPPVD